MTDDQKAVLATIENMTEAFHAADIEGVMRAYEPSASVAFEPGAAISGNANLRAGFQGFFAVKPQFTYSGHEVIIQGDIALHITPWNMTGTTPDGQPMAQSGLSVAVLRRQADGSWLMVIDNPHGQALMVAE
ncbi:MAG: SgcJ/EcaC family oxidoreductase [Rhodobacteraceae bacterium]|nr:SgcJ/EcaC family oxidoreductase [Paracoccaceae bacterium]